MSSNKDFLLDGFDIDIVALREQKFEPRKQTTPKVIYEQRRHFKCPIQATQMKI